MIKLIWKLVKNLIVLVIVVAIILFLYFTFFVDTKDYRIDMDLSPEIQEQKEAQIADLMARLENKEELSDQDLFDVYNGIGVQYFTMGEISKAIEYYKKANDVFPKDSVSLDNIGNAYAQVEEFEKAKDYYTQAIDLTPHRYYLYQHLVEAQKRLGEGKEAVSKTFDEAFDRISVLVDGNPEKVLIDYARYLESQGDYQGAKDKWQTILLNFRGGSDPEIEEEIQDLQDKIKAEMNR